MSPSARVSVKVAILCMSDPSTDPRPNRAIDLFRSLGYSISAVGYQPKYDLEVQSFLPLPEPSGRITGKIIRKIHLLGIACIPFNKIRYLLDSFHYGFNKVKKYLQMQNFDLLIVEDLQILPLAFEVNKTGKIIFDAREYYPRQREDNFLFNMIEKPRRINLCKDYLSRCDAILTVSEGLKDEYYKEFGVHAVVFRSTPYYSATLVRPTKQDNIRLVYHGVANRNRQIEKMIEIFALLDDRFALDLVLIGNEKYQYELKIKASQFPKIRFLDPVPYNKIITSFNCYDIGLLYFEPVTFNLKHCLPNKFFECIQSRLIIAIGPSPDMAAVVKHYHCGVIAEEFSVNAMAAALNALSAEDIDQAKKQSDLAARELNFEEESKILKVLFEALLRHKKESNINYRITNEEKLVDNNS